LVGLPLLTVTSRTSLPYPIRSAPLSDEADDKLFSGPLYLLLSQGARQESNCEMIENDAIMWGLME
jgi:hypothetical protein